MVVGVIMPPRVRPHVAKLLDACARPVDAASLAVFRIGFGAMMIWELWRYFRLDRINGYYVRPAVLFPFYGFGWLRPLPGPAMHALFGVLLLLAVLVALGFWYRFATILFFVGYTYTFLLDQSNYQNHLYLFCLLSFLLVVVDAHRVWSLDSLRARQTPQVVPLWQLGIVAFQVGVVYVYGGINKLSAEWLSAVPMDLELEEARALTWAPEILLSPSTARVFAWSGLAIDLMAVPMLLGRKTRLPMFAVLSAFHVMNAIIFSIGIFPWFMLVATTILLPPGWPRALVRRRAGPRPTEAPDRSWPAMSAARGALLGIYVLIQLLVPLRQHLYPDAPAWTHDGQYFAWTMKLHVRRGVARLWSETPSGGQADVPLSRLLTPKQLQHLAYTPDMVVLLSRFVVSRFPSTDTPRLYWSVVLSLNGRTPQSYIEADAASLAQRAPTWRPTRFVSPLRRVEPLTLEELAVLRQGTFGATTAE
jgi:hypothetical protein